MPLRLRTPEELKQSEFLKLSEVARLLNVSPFVLTDIAGHSILPAHTMPCKRAKYYRLPEVRRILAALAPLREKEIPLKNCRAELLRLKWYANLFNPADNANQ